MRSYCSWCFEESEHELVEMNTLRRDVYRCKKCGNHTLQCRIPGCLNMTRGKPKSGVRSESIIEELKAYYDNELCAEHDGTIASFKNLKMGLDDIEDYERLFKRERVDFGKVGKIAALAVGGGLVFGPAAYVAAPAIASAIGALGVLGAAGTGIAIEGLSGAALTSASLAALGGGTMAGGMIFMTAAGAALGAIKGGVIANNYFGEIDDFRIIKLNEGRLGKKPAIVLINGFLSQKSDDARDWKQHLRDCYLDYPWYLVTWESGVRYELGKEFALDRLGKKAFEFAGNLSKRATRKGGPMLSPLTWAAIMSDFVSHPWYTAMAKASMTGILLADILARTKGQEFIFMGHSLGARVAFYALGALSTRTKKVVRDTFLFGGAVDRQDRRGWDKTTEAVKGIIHNCYSKNDLVLKYLYKGAMALISDPIGVGPILLKSEKTSNHDCSEVVDSHMTWKNHLGEIFNQIEASSEGKRQGRKKA